MLGNIPENEQWRTNGICDKCRRGNYCSTPCTRNKMRQQSIAYAIVFNAFNTFTGGAYREIMSKSAFVDINKNKSYIKK